MPRQTAQQTAPAAEEWKSPEALSFLIRRFCPDGIRSGAIRPGPGHVWGGYRLESTPPVPAEGMSLVAYVHEHRLAAERAGQEVWNFVAGGRISAEPVVHENLAFFGSHDGYVYAVNVKDGSLAWRFLAAPADKRHVAFGQVESAWPVFSVRNKKILLRAGNPVPYAEVALVEDIKNPKDTIVNPKTLIPPWRGPAK